MSSIELAKVEFLKSEKIKIYGSKSETNRWLILNALYPNKITLKNLSNAKDAQVMQTALASGDSLIDIHHAGTAMRFLTAYFATQSNKSITLTGSQRMKERPIKILVDALKQLGADVNYEKNIGYPPLRIEGKTLTKSKVTLSAHVSSQYITALLLIAPKLPQGLELTLEGKITSLPYIEMTLAMLRKVGIEVSFTENVIKVEPAQEIKEQTIAIESDWSSASYYYSMLALSEKANVTLSTFYKSSLQGDAAVAEIYEENFGVKTTYKEGEVYLYKDESFHKKTIIQLDLNKTPDLAQTIAVTCVGLKIKAELTGLETLKIKETDRLLALKNELEKFGAVIRITDDTLYIKNFKESTKNIKIKTYNDHRMALAFAPLALITSLTIEDANVVEKSYPTFWDDFKQVTN